MEHHPAGALRELTAALVAKPDSPTLFNDLATLLLEQRRYALLWRWLEWWAAHGASSGLAEAFALLGARLTARPLEHALADRALARAEELAARSSGSTSTLVADVRRQRERLRALRAGLAGLVRELRSLAVEERDRKRAAALYLQIAELHAAYDSDPQFRLRVQENLERCFLLYPAMPPALDSLERLALEWHTVPAAIDALTEMARTVADRGSAAELWVRQARLTLAHQGDPATFEAGLRSALAREPGRLDAAFSLAELLISREAISQGAEVLAQALLSSSAANQGARALPLELADLRVFAARLMFTAGRSPEAGPLLAGVVTAFRMHADRLTQVQLLAGDLKLAEIVIEALEARLALRPTHSLELELRSTLADALIAVARPREAFGALALALRLDPDRPATWEAIEDLASELKIEDDLEALYAEVVEERGRGRSVAALARRRAEWLERRPGGLAAETVAEAWRFAAGLGVADAVVQSGVTRAEARLKAPPPPKAEDELPRLIEAGRFREAAELVARRSEQAPDDAARDALRRTQADLLLRGGELGGALIVVQALLQAHPGDVEALALVERIAQTGEGEDGVKAGPLVRAYLALGDFAHAVPLLEQEALALALKPRAAELWGEAARLYEDELVDRQSALRALVEACRVAPSNEGVRQELARIARELRQQEPTARKLAELAASAEKESARVLLRLASALAEEAGAGALQAELQRTILRSNPADFEVLSQASGQAMVGGDAEQAVALLQRRIAASGKPRERADLSLQAGKLLLGALARPAEAAALLRQAVELGADAGEALRPLAEALLAAGDPMAAAEVLDREVGHWAVKGDPAKAVRVGLQRAQILRQGGSLEDAVQAYQEVLLRRASEPAALQALEDMLSAGEAAKSAAEVLAEVYGDNHDLQKLADVLQMLADSESDLAARSRILRRVAALYQGDLRLPAQAFAALARAVRLSPADEALRAELTRLATAEKLEAQLAELWLEVAERVPEIQAPEFWQELAELSEKLGATDQASEFLLRILTREDGAKKWHPRALRTLQRIQLGRGEVEASLETTERLLELTEPPAERLALLRDSAKLAEQRLGDGLRAIELWHHLLEEEAEDSEAAAELERLSEAYGVITEQAEALAARLRQAGGTASPAGRPLALRLAGVRRAQKATAAALELLGGVLLADPENAGARKQLREWALSSAPGSAEAFALLDQKLELPEAEARVAQAELREARLALASGDEHRALSERIADRAQAEGSPAEAQAALDRWAEQDPTSPLPLVGLVRIHRSSDNVEGLVSALWRLAHVPAQDGTPQERKGLLFEVGSLREEKMNDPEGAMAAYREILAIEPNDPSALQKLSALLGRASRWDELIRVLSQRAEQALVDNQRQEAAEVQLQLALILQRHLRDYAGALSYYRSVLAEQPRHPGVMAGLEPILSEASAPEERAQAAQLLEPIYAHARNLPGLVAAVQAQVEGRPSGPERAALLRRLAQIYLEQLKNPEMAFVSAGQALREEPESAQSVDLAFEVAKAAGLFEELAELLEGVAPYVQQPEASRRIHWNLATLYQGALHNPLRAIAEWRQVLELAPDDRSAFEQLSSLYVNTGDLASLLDVLRRQLAVSEELETRRFLLHRIGEIQDERQNDAQAAFGTYRRLLELDPADTEAMARLAKLAESLKRWPELAALLEQQASLAAAAGQPEEQAAHLSRLAAVHAGPLRNPEAAEDLYARILDLAPNHPETLTRLEAALAANPQSGRIAELLERAHRGGQNWAKVASALDVRASAMADPQARRDVLIELAKIQEEKLARPDMAFIALTRAFRDDPSDAEARAALERASRLSESHEELAALYEETLEKEQPESLVAALSLQLGMLHDGPLQDPSRALVFLERARELAAPGARAALPALERLYAATERWDRLGEILEEEVALAQDPPEKVALLFRLAQIAEERLTATDRASSAYEAILALEPHHLPALRALQRLYALSEKPDELFRVLKTEIELTPEGVSRDRLTARLAEVAANQLNDPAQARELWSGLLAKNPQAEQALAGMEAALEKLGQWEELAEFLKQRAKSTTDPREASRLNDKLGLILGQRLGRADEAIQSFKAVLERDPKSRRALMALRDIYQQRGEREEMAAVLRRLIPLQENAAGVKEVRLQLAEALGELGRREEAVEAARRALDLEPHTPEELRKAEALFRSLKAFPELARVLEARAGLAGEGARDESVELLLESAQIHAEQLRKPEAGASALERVLEMDPANERATTELKRIYTKTGDWRRYATLLDRLANRAEDPVVKVAVLKELALVQEQKLGEKELAFLALCRALQATPLDEALGESALRLSRGIGTLEELSEVYENVADSLSANPSSPDVEGIFLRLSHLQDTDLDQPKAAEESLRRLLALQPGNQRALDALGELFVRRGRSREYVVTMEQKVETLDTLEEKKQVLLTLARAYDELLGEPADALLTLRRALDLDPGDGAVVQQLVLILRREKAWPDLVALLQRTREMASDPIERSKLQLQIAEINELWLGDEESALSAYHLALELDPQSWGALEALERLYTKLDRGAELLRVYDRQIDLVEPADRAKVLFKAAQIWEQKLGNAANAVACLEGVLQVDGSNPVALRELERLYRGERDWEHLALTYQRHLEVADEHQDIVALHVSLGDVLYRELGRADQAEMLFARALEIDPTSQPALRGLGQLYEGSGNWAQSLEMIRREVRLAASSEQAVQLYTRAGHIFEEMLLDLSEAEGAYRRALEIEPGYLPALRALKRLTFGRKDWDAYIEVAKQEAQVAPEGPDKAHLHHEIGRFYQDVREDMDSAERHYAEALRRLPAHLESAQPLSDIYVARSAWEPAERMLDIVVAEMRDDDARELCRQYYRLGYVAEKLDHTDKALEAYRRAYELDATYLPALEGLGSLLVRGKHFDEALKIYQAILIHHRDELTDLEVVEIYWQIGEIHRALSQLDRAQKSYEKALEIDASHEPSHQAVAELLEGVGNYEQALEHRQKLLETLEGDARFEASVQLARLARERLSDPYQAIDAYSQALKTRNDSVAVMEALLALYRETKQGQKAVEILERMLDQPLVQDDTRRQRDLRLALAEVYRDEIRDDERAIEQFNRALDLDPTHLASFAAIETLLTEGERWPLLEESYHAMIKRLPKTPEAHQARMALWKALGELYQKVLKNREGALLAYEVVVKAEPENAAVVELLADLYAGTPGKEQQAIEAQRRALLTTSDPVKVVKTLVRLHASLKEYDKAYVAAQVLVHLLGERSPDEEQIIVRLKRYAKESATKALTERNWSEALTHERLKSPLAEILGICQAATDGAFAVDASRLNINRKRDKVDVQSSMLFFVNMFKYVAKTLAMETLELFKVPGQAGLILGNTFPPCLLAGEDMFKDRAKRELFFVIAKAMAFSRPELAMARLHPIEDLEAIVQAAIVSVVPNHAVTGDPEAVDRARRKLDKSLSEAARQPLSRAVREALSDPAQLDLRSYLEGVEHSANRAGVLLCTDVEVAMRCFAQDQGAAARLPLRAKVRDLMIFCLGEPYFKLRQSLGISVDVKAEGRANP